MVCPTCGYAVKVKKSFFATEEKKSLPRSRAYCKNCGGRVDNKAIICPNCNRFSIGKKTLTNPNDKVSLGLCLVALLVPLFGLIYWPLKHKEMPEKAQAVGVISVVSAVIFLNYLLGFSLLSFL